MPSLKLSPLWLALIPCLAAAAEDKKLEPVKFMGDIRLEYRTLHRDDRDGKEDVTDDFRTRIRAGFEFGLSDQWSARVRAAGRYTTLEGPTRFYVKPYAEGSSGTGLDNNHGTIDEANMTWAPSKAFSLQFGRMQTKFAPDDVLQKALGRKDSPSSEISWTDGVYFKFKHDFGFAHHLIWQHNDDEGTTNAQRPPLDTRESGDTWFYSFGSDKRCGFLQQCAIDISHMPDGLRVHGISSANTQTENYTAVIGRATWALPLNDNGFEFRLAGEYGHAVDTQTQAAARLGTSGDVDADAFQLTANLMNMAPGHSLALLYMEADAGWLISPDLAGNSDMLELRYQWKLDKHQTLETRVRRREDLEQQTNRPEVRVDKDAFLRYTYKF
ncbi:MAG: hypothetical protein HYV16_00055 [Gammaproteobacteria bacterium]|nr:hypothetical protein [Gammaproteobacteria bacterium]